MSTQRNTRRQAEEASEAAEPSRELEAVWAELEHGVRPILDDPRAGLSRATYMRLYALVIDYCTVNRPMPDMASQGAYLRGGALYRKLRDFLQAYLVDLESQFAPLAGEALLAGYAQKWTNYTLACHLYHNIFQYLNRYWVKRQQDEDRKSPYIYNLGLTQWKDTLFERAQPRLTQAVLDLIERQRQGELMDASLVHDVLASYVALKTDVYDSAASSAAAKPELDVYLECFQQPFLATTRAFYKREGETFAAANSVYAYLAKAETQLRSEEERCLQYLNPVTLAPLLEACSDVLLVHHLPRIHEALPTFFEEERLADLSRLYGLLARVSGGLSKLVEALQAHVEQEGLQAVRRLVEESKAGASGAAADDEGDDDDDMGGKPAARGPPRARPAGLIAPKSYVDTIFEVYAKFQTVIRDAFQNDVTMVRALHAACKQYINHNVLSQRNRDASGKTIALYADAVLRKSSKVAQEQHLETTIENIMAMYRFLESPDAFEEWYQKTLSKRLLFNQSVSDEAEELLLAKIRDHRGANETAKYHKMFQDMTISKDLADTFRKRTEGDAAVVDVDVKVCTAGVWPMAKPDPKQPNANTNFIVPREIAPAHERFHQYYMEKHTGRVLHWMWNQSRADLRVSYPPTREGGRPSTYIFTVTAHQMALLLQFNDTETLSVEDLMLATGLPGAAVVGAATWLLKGRVLKVDGAGAAARLEQDTRLRLNMEFRNKKVRLNFAKMTKEDADLEDRAVLEKIQEGRRMMTQAAMVRIMKARKSLPYNNLVAESISLIRNRFLPQVAEVKKCIDILMEKEFIRRDDNERSLLHYIA